MASTNLGNTLWKLGDWINALQYYKMNLALSESEGDLWDLITAYNNVGIIEFSRGDFVTAAEYFEKSVRIDEKIGAVEYEALARENLAEALEMLGRWNDALVAVQPLPRVARLRRDARLAIVGLHPAGAPDEEEGRHRQGDGVRAEGARRRRARARRGPRSPRLATSSANIEDERENFAEAERYLARTHVDFRVAPDHAGAGARAHGRGQHGLHAAAHRRSARDHAELGGKYASQLDDRFTLAKNDWMWGKILSSQGDREAANAKFESARDDVRGAADAVRAGAAAVRRRPAARTSRKRRRRRSAAPSASSSGSKRRTISSAPAARFSASSPPARRRTAAWSVCTKWSRSSTRR